MTDLCITCNTNPLLRILETVSEKLNCYNVTYREGLCRNSMGRANEQPDRAASDNAGWHD